MSRSQDSVSQTLRRFTREAEPDDRGRLTKQDLYRRAKALDIPRRSAMTKHELRQAIARREG